MPTGTVSPRLYIVLQEVWDVGRTLRYIGLAVLACALWAMLAGERGWVESATAEMWLPALLWVGIACVAAGIGHSLLAPVLRRLRRGRCQRCGAPIEQGQTYCLDHLKATLNEYQDHMRDRTSSRRGDPV